MTSRERVVRTLEFDSPDRAPRDLWALPGVGMLRGGVIAQCEWGVRDPSENIEAVFETWLEANHTL